MDKQEYDDTGTGQSGVSDTQNGLTAHNTLQTPVVDQYEENKSGWKSFFLETLQTVVLALILYFLIDTVVARVRVDNISMEPTLQPGEFLLVDRVTYRLSELNIGDIIIFHYPQNPQEDYIKRVIGLAGDNVKIKEGVVYVNDTRLEEPYLIFPTDYEGEWIVPEDALFVLGDNRNLSFDSHSWGFVPEENVIGRAFFIYWPINEIKLLTQTQLTQIAVE